MRPGLCSGPFGHQEEIQFLEFVTSFGLSVCLSTSASSDIGSLKSQHGLTAISPVPHCFFFSQQIKHEITSHFLAAADAELQATTPSVQTNALTTPARNQELGSNEGELDRFLKAIGK